MTATLVIPPFIVIPAKAGIQAAVDSRDVIARHRWIPAFAGMTG